MGIDDESSRPRLVFRSCRRRYMPTSFGVSLFREPDAGNLPVRFDEREQETEPSQTGLRPRRESVVSSHRETKATAPVLDSTRHFTHNAGFRRPCFFVPETSPPTFSHSYFFVSCWLATATSIRYVTMGRAGDVTPTSALFLSWASPPSLSRS